MECLHTVEAAIDEVAHEQIIRVRAVPAHLKQLHEVVELPMYVATYRHRSVDRLNIGLLEKDLLRLVAKRLDLGLLDVFTPAQLLDLPVQVGHPHRRRPPPVAAARPRGPASELRQARHCARTLGDQPQTRGMPTP